MRSSWNGGLFLDADYDMRRRALALVVAVGATGLSSSAIAGEAEHVTVQVTASETYDSNVAASGASLASARAIQPQDTIFAPQVTANLSLPFSRQELFLKGTLGYSLYSRNSKLDSGAFDIQGGFASRVRDCHATLSGEYNDERTSLQNLTVAVTRNIEETETIRLDGGCGRDIGFGPTASVIGQWSSNSAALLFASDFRTVSGTAGIAYRRPGFGELSLVGSYGETDFPNRGLLVGPATTQDGYRDYGLSVRYDHKLGARIEGTIKIGYTKLSPFAAGVGGYSGVDIAADLSFRVSGRLQTHFALERTPLPTIVSNSTYSLETHYSAEADYTIGPKASVRLTGSETDDRYNGAALVPGLDIQRERVGAISGALRYQLSRRFGLELDAAHEVRSADISAYNFTDDRVTLAFSATI